MSRTSGRVFFTSDTHFGHRALVEKGWREGFSSVAEHDECLVQNWNDTVRPDDQVWHLGDFAMGGEQNALAMVRKLNGIKHLITGNHDHVWPGLRTSHRSQVKWIVGGWRSVQAYARKRIAGQNVMLCHFPYQGDHTGEDRYSEYRLPDQGRWLLHGHVHTAWAVRERQINVGVDVWGMKPVSLEEITAVITGAQEEDPPPRDLPGDFAVIRSVGALHEWGGRRWRWDGRDWQLIEGRS